MNEGSTYILLDLLAPAGPCGTQLLQALQGMDVSQLQYCNAEVGGARAVLKAGAAELDGPHPTATELPQHVFPVAAAAAAGTLQLEVVGEHLGEPGVQALLRGRGSEHVRLPAQHVAADGRTATFHVPFMPPTEQPGDQQSEHTAEQAPQQVVAKPSPHLPARPGLYWLCVTRGVWLGPSWPVLLVDPADEEVISLLPALDQHSSTATSSSSSSSSDKRALVVKLAAVLARARPDCYFAFQAAVPLKVLLHWARDVLRLAIRAGNMRARSLVRQVLAQPDVKALLGTQRSAAGARQPQAASKPSQHTEVEASTWRTPAAGGGGAAAGVQPSLPLPDAHKVLSAASGPRGVSITTSADSEVPAQKELLEQLLRWAATGPPDTSDAHTLGVQPSTSSSMIAFSRPVQATATGSGASRHAKDRAAEAAKQLSSGVTTYRKEVVVLAQKLEALLGRRLSHHPDVVKLYQYFFQALLQFAELTLKSGYEATLELDTFIEQFSSREFDARRLAALHEQARELVKQLRHVANEQIRVQLLVTELLGRGETEDDLHNEGARSKQEQQEQLEAEARKRQQRASSAKTGAEIGLAVGGVAAAAGAVGAGLLPPLALAAPVGAAVAALYSAYQQAQATKQKRKAAEKREAANAAADAEERAIESINSLRGLVPCIGAFRDAINSAVTGLNLVAAATERFMLCSRPEHVHDLGDFENVREELSHIAEGVRGQCQGLEDELPKLQTACRALYDAAASTFPAVIPARRQLLHTMSFPASQQQQKHQQHAPVPHFDWQNTYPAAACYPHTQQTHGQQPHIYHYQHPQPLQLHPTTSTGSLPPVTAATEYLSPPGHRVPDPYPLPPWP